MILPENNLNFEIGKGGIVKEIDKSKSIPTRIRESLKQGVYQTLT